ncbi:hypothetical protein VP1G_06228 [Cytospora mali]|uniref:Uncharacterized protein n=1 Tax=Cytospora mali TaxID=578113 RepID=A0A194V4X4_CYTMA|nr:hypothetical protein VP1G_06228 [Valsa mali var. pyri (nom. inval.)]
MAEPRSLDLTALEAVVTWTGTNGRTHCLSRRDNEPPTQVALDIKYKEIQVQSVALRTCRALWRLVGSLEAQTTWPTYGLAYVLGPNHSFSIYLDAHDLSSTSLLREFVDAIGDPAIDVQSTGADDIVSLYSGQGGRFLDDAELSASGPLAIPPSPPSYGNIEAPPPLAPLESEHVAGPSTSNKSRKRRRDSDIDETSTGPSVESLVETMYHRFHHDMKGTLRQSRDEDRAFMTELVEKVKSEIMAEIEKQKTEMKQYVDSCTDELDYRLADVERGVEDNNDRVDMQVDDAVVSYKIEVEEEKETFKFEMRGFVIERLDEIQDSAVEEIEKRGMERLNGAKVSIEQASIKLG